MSASGGGGKGGANNLPNRPGGGGGAAAAAGGGGGGASGGFGNVYDAASGALQRAGGAFNRATNILGNVGNIAGGIDRYMNPYENKVINRSIMDMNRMTNIQQNQNAAEALGAGAFGGDRHGIVEAMTNSEAQKNIGDLASQLRHQGFSTAAGLAGQDIQNKMAKAQGLLGAGGAGQSLGMNLFGIGNDITQQQMGAGSVQQQLIDRIMGAAGGQYQQFMSQPQNLLNMNLAALGMNPLNQATTTTGSYKPGLLDWAGLAAQGLGAWRMGA